MTPRHPALQAFLDKLTSMTDPTARMLLEGSGHPRACRCPTCLQWWLACGSETDTNGNPAWGPFTAEEITREAVTNDDPTKGH